jgi:hypothetical protein
MPKKPHITVTDGGLPHHVNIHVDGKAPAVVHQDRAKQHIQSVRNSHDQ